MPESQPRTAIPVEPLLKTKLFIPRVRPGNVARPRLFALLEQGLASKVTLVAAPAGFGKTTLLSAWAATERGQARDLAWVSLEEGDNHPTRFWLYVVQALERLQPGVAGAVLQLVMGTQPAPPDTVVRLLINQLAEWPREALLILDDYHMITSEEIHRLMTLLVEHLPPQVRLVLTTRVDPSLPLTRWRARGELAEVRLKELRFTSEEAAEFFAGAMGLRLTPDQVARLEARTEGWVAGLQLAALSLQGSDDVERFVEAFAGSHQYVVDYLLEEVLHQQPPEVQEFLLQTAVLDRLVGPLCDAVTGGSGAQALLESLERRNLFVIALDHQRQWYRYHHLFAEVLRSRLAQERPAEALERHRRASRWYEANELVELAANHALAAGEHDRAVALVSTTAEAIWHRGDSGILVRWLEALPETLVRSHPDVAFSVSWALLTTGRIELADSLLQSAEDALTADPTHSPILLGKVLAARGHIARVNRNMDASAEFSRRALALLPPDEPWRGMTHWNLAAIHQWTGASALAVADYEESRRIFTAAGDLYGFLRATTWYGEVLADIGEMARAMAECEAALAAAVTEGGERLPMVSIAHVGLGELCYEQHDLAEAERHLLLAEELSREGGVLDVTWMSYIPLALTRLAQGDGRAALHYTNLAYQIAPRVPWALAVGATARVEILLALGEREQAGRFAPQLEALAREQPYPMERAARVLARVKIEQGYPEEALALLAPLAARGGPSIRLSALLAIAHQAAGQADRALDHLGQALALAAPSGSVAPFLELGRPMAILLGRFHERRSGREQSCARRLLDLLGVAPSAAGKVVPGLLEPPSERELEVLALLAEGASNDEIAQRLYISLHTAKKHVANLLGKLSAANRTQAVARGRELGLVE